MPARPVQYNKVRPDRHPGWRAAVLVAGLSVVLVAVHLLVLHDQFSIEEALVDGAVMALGLAIFAVWAKRRLQQREAQIQRHVDQLEALHSASLALSAELDLGVVLQEVVDLSRALVHARYGALGVLAEDGRFLEQFITSGLSAQERAAIGRSPRGHGLLGASIRADKPIRIPEVADDARSVGYPPRHPVMRSLLSVPVRSKGRVIGTLFLADKLERTKQGEDIVTPFSEEDQSLLSMFAVQAAVAIENARLYRQNAQLTLLEERERFRRDLHDGIIQSIYAIGLMLEDAQHRIETSPQTARARIGQAIQDLNDVILDIRNYILHLRPRRFQGCNLRQGLQEMVRELRADTFLHLNLEVEGPEPSAISAEATSEILAIAQEALANVRRHALASRATVRLQTDAQQLALAIEDNGIGFSPAAFQSSNGSGLSNMRHRARRLNAQLRIDSAETGGTRVQLLVPLNGG